jgi:hypothetical protein
MTQNRLFNGRTLQRSGGMTCAHAPAAGSQHLNSIDIGHDRRDTGGWFECKQRNSPLYFRIDTNYVEREGTKIGASSTETSPGNGFTDLIILINYRTTNASAEVGYNTPQYHFAANYLISQLTAGSRP